MANFRWHSSCVWSADIDNCDHDILTSVLCHPAAAGQSSCDLADYLVCHHSVVFSSQLFASSCDGDIMRTKLSDFVVAWHGICRWCAWMVTTFEFVKLTGLLAENPSYGGSLKLWSSENCWYRYETFTSWLLYCCPTIKLQGWKIMADFGVEIIWTEL